MLASWLLTELAASVTGFRPLTVTPAGVVAASVTFSDTLPLFTRVIVSVTPVPGVLLTRDGELVIFTASTLGTVKFTVCDCVMAGLVVLVAVTVKESCVPGGGIGWLLLGCK